MPVTMSADRIDAQLCYLLVTPIGPVASANSPEAISRRLRDAPYFTPTDIDIRLIGSETIDVEGVRVSILRQSFDGLAQIAECRFALPDVLSVDTLHLKARVQAGLKSRLAADQIDAGGMTEEYLVLMLNMIEGTADEFLDRQGQALARFIRSQREVFGPLEIEQILVSRVRYSHADLIVVDWEGAVIISPEGDFQSDIELLKIGNYQLLRYRLLDRTLERNLQTVSDNLQTGTRASLLPNRPKRVLRQVIEQRLEIMLDFEKIDQSLLLIGDWYTAKVYKVIYEEFYLDEWKSAIRSKLDNLESIVQIIQENFTFSWSRFLEMVQIAGWLLLLVGYFVLFYLEASKGK